MIASTAFLEEVWSRWGSVTTFRARMRYMMAEHGVSQRAVARRSGLDIGDVNRWIGSNASVAPEMGTMVILEESLLRLIVEQKSQALAA